MLFVTLMGCAEGDKGSGTGNDTGSPASCGVLVEETLPANASTNAFHRDPVIFTLSDSDPTATITAPVAGVTTSNADHSTFTFTPFVPLTPSTDYTFTLDYCGGVVDLEFRTSEVGRDPVNTSPEGRAWEMPLADGRGFGIFSAFTEYLPQSLDLTVGAVDDESIALTMSTTNEFCDASEVTASFAYDPYVEATFDPFWLSVGGYTALLSDPTFQGTFAADGTYVVGTLTGLLDTRQLAGLVSGGSQEGAFCAEAEAEGEACEACPDGEELCYPLVLDGLVGGEVTPPVCP